MPGLVEEIQRDALDDQVPVSTLLRKAKLAAAKLQLPAVEEWVNHELNGYGQHPVPPYRQIRGVPKAFNPYNGWIPIMGVPKLMEAVSKANNGQGIAAIEDLLKDSENDTFHQPLSPQMIHALNKNADIAFGEMANFVGRGVLVGIIDKVRNMVLDWAIELEKSGVKGEGMSFKQEEKIAAQSNPAITIGTVGNFVGVIGSHNNVRDIVGGSINITRVRDLAQQLRLSHNTLVAAGADGNTLSSAVDGLIIETEKSEPDAGRLRGLLTDARSALAGAAGNLMASGALTLISSLLGS
ncbi:hypothetical protein [Agrobacterium deltaense]|uniref:AbiTii domain-containing protein n=1 Tax=Agrobacterium deltaense TaxID=1183412 RepID=UPI000F638507|nr:hypothetical protein [Agrobacterium deltaense]RRN75989.1 hypothetical protein EIQ31_02605 [Agrobacterium deltaense]